MVFQVGQKVVCIDDQPAPTVGLFIGKQVPLKRGTVYTVAGLGTDRLVKMPTVQLVEIPSRGQGFLARRFRPVAELQQFRDIVAEVFAKAPAKTNV